uniref:Uncharacterized protein n=1 Tax=Aegilops tauschii subsp. strangulata TaxID=200361 RepID=A0A453SES8_AEGTS
RVHARLFSDKSSVCSLYCYFALWKVGKQIVHMLGCKQNFWQVLLMEKYGDVATRCLLKVHLEMRRLLYLTHTTVTIYYRWLILTWSLLPPFSTWS